MWIVAAVLTMLCFGINNMIFKVTSGKGLSKVHMQFFFYLIAFLLMFSYGTVIGFASFNSLTIVLGAVIGILNANGNIQMSMAFEKGPASITSPLISTNTVIPILSAALIFQEHITLIQWIGIIVMLASAAIIQYVPGNGVKMEYKPWMYRVLLSVTSFGVLGVLMKTTSYFHIDSINTLVCMYGGGAVYLMINSLFMKEKWQRKELKLGIIIGCISVVGYSSYFFALSTGVASIVFPIVSLSCLVVVLSSCWLYKERLKLYQIIGVISALIGIVLTKL
ncbi:DMT family transporter [Pseudoneobacillus rhizosphaerae]|uniref:4-amino-4-deoxy-L-arabinose-phosphoundecaprenol flippase subunit ArnE n=1 Tax=Pseudoneobacillus rhizosphaerae TaxID=2880968 RepID=A0A9C7G6W5_9BACI|nr:DMT family transporter [Pseudoneobacillus rhizosphaerae]CAG9606836.1 4-amino-4-deoxy-L-arabinose-phosphoundecaprenol flippase subunit ArnE [Pseudoneobacillus rhizosphaerae]